MLPKSKRNYWLVAGFALAVALAAPRIATAKGLSLVGSVQSGSTPITGSNVSVYAAGTGAPTLLTSAVTDSSGKFSVSIAPSGNAVVYVQAIGGNVGSAANPAINLVDVMGVASSLGHHNVVTVNELTTAAAAWALAHFIAVGAGTAAGPISGPSPTLQNASATCANLADPNSGGDASLLTSGGNSPARLNTIANVIAACVSAQPQCAALFADATPASGNAPADTLGAAVDMALNPASNVAGLFALISATPPYTPSLAAPPDDFTIALNFSGGGINQPQNLAIDAVGNIWVANLAGNNVVEMSPAGTFVSGRRGFSGGINEPVGLAIDLAGNVWVTNFVGNSVTELNSTGTPVAGSPFTSGGVTGPIGIAADPADDIWIADSAGSATEYPGGNPSASIIVGGFGQPEDVAIDASNNVWLTDFRADTVTELNSAGGSLGVFGTGSGPAGVAVDAAGNTWVADFLGSNVTEIPGGFVPTATNPTPPIFAGGSVSQPHGIAVDGSGNVWVANDVTSGSVTELAGAQAANPGAVLSPSSGFTGGAAINSPYGIAIDSAGDVWVSDSANAASGLTELIGAAAPVKTPLVGPPLAP